MRLRTGAAFAVLCVCLVGCGHSSHSRRHKRKLQRQAEGVDAPKLFATTVAAFERGKKGGLDAATCEKLATDFELADKAWNGSEPAALFNAGAVWEACGDVAKAEALYVQLESRDKAVLALKNKKEQARKGRSLAAAHNNRGVIAWSRGDHKAAMGQFKRAIALNPHTAAPRNNLAAALRRTYARSSEDGAFTKAENELQSALAVDSNSVTAYENLARLYYDRGRLQDKSYLMLADLVVTQAIRLFDELGQPSPEIYNLRGLLFMEREDKVNGLRAFKKATEIDPKHRNAHLNIAMVALRFRSYEEAERSLRVAMAGERAVRNVDAHLGLGVALRGQRKYDAAEKAFKRALDLGKGDPRPLYNLGILYQEHLAPASEGNGREQNLEAKGYFKRFLDDARGNKSLAANVRDAEHRVAKIDEYIEVLAKMEKWEKEAKEVERKAKLEEERRRKELLELEKRARAANEAASNTDSAASGQ